MATNNGTAWQNTAIRTGIGLEYLSEKSGNAVKYLWNTLKEDIGLIPEQTTVGDIGRPCPPSMAAQKVRDVVANDLKGAFRAALLTWLGLNNQLEIIAANDHLIDDLLKMSYDDFMEWFRKIDEDGDLFGGWDDEITKAILSRAMEDAIYNSLNSHHLRQKFALCLSLSILAEHPGKCEQQERSTR